jgi:hypothetical protein
MLRRLLWGVLFGAVVQPFGCEETRTTEVTLYLPQIAKVCKGASTVLPEFKKKIGQIVNAEKGASCEITDVTTVDKGPNVVRIDGVSQCEYVGTATLDNCEEHGGCLDGGGRPLVVGAEGRAARQVRRADWG